MDTSSLKSTVFALSILFLTACGQQTETEKQIDNRNPSLNNDNIPIQTGTIVGEWLISRVNGEAHYKEFPVLIKISDDTIYASSQCIWYNWEYILNNDQISVQPKTLFDDNGNPQPMCARGLSDYENLFSKIISEATQAELADKNTVKFISPDGSITATRRDHLTVILPMHHVEEGQPFMQALGGGTLVQEGRCIYADSGEFKHFLIWPDNVTRWDENKGEIIFMDRRYKAGDNIRFGGGESRPQKYNSPPAPYAFFIPSAPECDTSLLWYVSPEDVSNIP